MPRGPKGEKRPADAIGNAVMIGRIATNEIKDLTETTKAAATLGKKGGNARAASLTARRAHKLPSWRAEARWKKGGS